MCTRNNKGPRILLLGMPDITGKGLDYMTQLQIPTLQFLKILFSTGLQRFQETESSMLFSLIW